MASNVAAPTNPAFFQLNDNNPADPAHQITVSGTAVETGTPGKVNLVCTYGVFGGGTGVSTLACNVTVNPDGSFSWTGPPVSSEEPCVLRAVPVGAGLPTSLASFTGPTVGIGDFSTNTISTGPNNGQMYDFYDSADQLAGAADYKSVGSGGLNDAYPADPSTLVLGEDLFFSTDYLANRNPDRSDVEIDGVPAYAPATARTLVSGAKYLHGPSIRLVHVQPGPDDRQRHHPRVRAAGAVRADADGLSGDHIKLHEFRPDRSELQPHDRPGPGRASSADH